ncbi:MAG: hydrogenase nickel incorporation protein HypB [Nitrospinota bacterium]|nr:hydrogenase nickel incorporation protein HypB [Nitrospinota bacterium]
MTKIIKVEKKILEKNDIAATRLREKFGALGIAVVNIMSSPGAGKTTLLAETIKKLKGKLSIGVIAGDIATDHDAKILEDAGAEWAVQINTGGRCHLEAVMVEESLDGIPEGIRLLIIENIGNLVCPAGYDLGENYTVMLGALTEGADKPKKYPGMYRACSHLVINKIDLEDALGVTADSYEREALEVNPSLATFRTSAKTGEGLDSWCDWLFSVADGKG